MDGRAAHRVFPVSVELLRGGPPNNQLLSKITDYTALCGNLSAATVRLPFNHDEIEVQIERLSYVHSDALPNFTLGEIAVQTKEILDQIPGIAPGLSQAYENRSDITHLRMVLTPHELALVPFEAAETPDGAPGGAGAKLLLQSAAPVTMTREVRGVPSPDIRWPRQPRVLFAWAELPDGGDVPFQAHLRALREALSLWLPPFLAKDGNGERVPPEVEAENERKHNVRAVSEMLTLLPNATIQDIYDACEATPYTHVHILAHGVPKRAAAGQKSVGIALRSASSPTEIDIVDGARLAAALRFQDKQSGQLPAMVVLASCDSGRQRSVITRGGSIAHELHVAGIPLVVASQFPLSKPGSVILARELYRRTFQGEDPRVALYYVRRKLYSTHERHHDWASLVAYACLPRDFDQQIRGLQYTVAKRRIENLLNQADRLIHSAPSDPNPGAVGDALKRIFEGLDRAAEELQQRGDDTSETLGLVASTRKRKAELLYRADSNQYAYRARSLDSLADSKDTYRLAMHTNLSEHWTGVQYLCLNMVLRMARGEGPQLDEAAWSALHYAASSRRNAGDRSSLAYAEASLLELYLLKCIANNNDPDARVRAGMHARAFATLVAVDSFELYSTRRQLLRYRDWWSQELLPQTPGLPLYGLVDELLQLLPEPVSS